MKYLKLYSALNFILFSFLIIGCGRPSAVNTMEGMNTSPESHSIINPTKADSSLFGTYRGVIPCDDCGQTQVKLTLLEDDSYELQRLHLNDLKKICTDKGDFKYIADKKMIRLVMEGEDMRLSTEEDYLQLIDKDGEKVITSVSESPYLYKSELGLGLAFWKVISIYEQKTPKNLSDKSYLQFRADETVSYSGGCNSCRGSYKTLIENEIMFRVGPCTKMMCQEDLDEELYKYLPLVNEYEIKGNQLILSDKGKHLMIFESAF